MTIEEARAEERRLYKIWIDTVTPEAFREWQEARDRLMEMLSKDT